MRFSTFYHSDDHHHIKGYSNILNMRALLNISLMWTLKTISKMSPIVYNSYYKC